MSGAQIWTVFAGLFALFVMQTGLVLRAVRIHTSRTINQLDRLEDNVRRLLDERFGG